MQRAHDALAVDDDVDGALEDDVPRLALVALIEHCGKSGVRPEFACRSTLFVLCDFGKDSVWAAAGPARLPKYGVISQKRCAFGRLREHEKPLPHFFPRSKQKTFSPPPRIRKGLSSGRSHNTILEELCIVRSWPKFCEKFSRFEVRFIQDTSCVASLDGNDRLCWCCGRPHTGPPKQAYNVHCFPHKPQSEVDLRTELYVRTVPALACDSKTRTLASSRFTMVERCDSALMCSSSS